MTLSARDDDAALLEQLATQTCLGTVTRNRAQGNSRPQVIWSIAAKADCARLVEILSAHPLRGQKSRDYAIWSAAVDWWVDDNPGKTVRYRDWTPMIYLKDQLRASRRYAPREAHAIRDPVEGLNGDWPGFIAGFFTAEGSVGIRKNGAKRLLPTAQLTVRGDDLPLLRELQGRTGVGRIYWSVRPKENSAPSAIWMVRDGAGVLALASVFDSHPLRGRKHREFVVWREAVSVYAEAGSAAAKYERLSELRAELTAARAYPG